ncbi:MAG: redoxin domain-containing protein [Thaumarchaeota archaeon]|jgi:thiol-disulfide isomerase/thioredoxin|nr:redoxin domain-containing protein [Nitrososphaerota archaeon]MBT5841979.1 redoxin domain-containing protein [Nitrososphaerota archaeon]MBT6468375.1 redoxin domain-containing protein [Nitrososphaerota archaeon]
MKTEVKTALIFVAVIAVAIGTISTIFSSFDNINTADTQEKIDKTSFKKAPDLVGIAHYLNTTPEELISVMENKVILYDIWTYSCINCVRTLPYITAWDDKYSDQGLLVIGIHSPEFEFEKNPKNVQMAIAKHGINYPVVLDNDMETWKAFDNRYWPRKYIADHEGYIRYDHIGEGGYKETEKIIQQLIQERSQSFGIQSISDEQLVEIKEFEHTMFRTPELYFGYKFAENRNQLGNSEGFQPEKTVTYLNQENIDLHKFYLTGDWKNHQDSMELISDSGTIKLLYNAKEVNIVTDSTAELEIFLDGEPLSEQYVGKDISINNILKVSEPDIYNIINSETSSSHIMEIKIKGKGFQMFTFTFG